MSSVDLKETYLSQMEELDMLYKAKSQELINCTSMTREMKIKQAMLECEVQKKVLKRKLSAIETASV